MDKKKTTAIILLVLTGIFLNNDLKSQGRESITACSDDSIRLWLGKFHVPGVAIGIIENNKIKSINYYGEIRPGIAVNDQTLWNVASLTKPVTASTVIGIINAGKLGLDEPVFPYFVEEDVKDDPWAKKLTPRIFMSHQTGFKNWKRMEPDKKLRFHYEPGKGYGYSGFGCEYLRQAVEKKMGKNMEQLANEYVFIPAGMYNTHFGWNDSLDSNRFAWAYNDYGIRYNYTYKVPNAADWLVTTMDDYCRFSLYVINGEGISGKIFKEVTSIQVHMDTLSTHLDEGMGLGWEIIHNLPHGEYALTHNGSDDGVATIVLLFPNSKRGIIVFTNGDQGKKVISNVLKNSKIDIEPKLAKYMGEFN